MLGNKHQAGSSLPLGLAQCQLSACGLTGARQCVYIPVT